MKISVILRSKKIYYSNLCDTRLANDDLVPLIWCVLIVFTVWRVKDNT